MCAPDLQRYGGDGGENLGVFLKSAIHALRGASIVTICAFALAGCANFDKTVTADSIAASARLGKNRFETGGFSIVSYSRIGAPTAPLVVYIEGDGLAWVSRTEVAIDPTPRDPLGLRLAAADPGPNVLYLARPCHYPPPGGDPRCGPEMWTDRRFSEEAVRAMNGAIDRFGPRGVRLVGYSGGGAIATLIAARRRDIIDLRTVAGNLDHVALNSYHKVTQQRGSLNPADSAANLANLPQLHLIGGRDPIVVPSVADSYLRRSGRTDCVTLRRIEGATHSEGWIDIWRELAPRPVACRESGRG